MAGAPNLSCATRMHIYAKMSSTCVHCGCGPPRRARPPSRRLKSSQVNTCTCQVKSSQAKPYRLVERDRRRQIGPSRDHKLAIGPRDQPWRSAHALGPVGRVAGGERAARRDLRRGLLERRQAGEDVDGRVRQLRRKDASLSAACKTVDGRARRVAWASRFTRRVVARSARALCSGQKGSHGVSRATHVLFSMNHPGTSTRRAERGDCAAKGSSRTSG
jgi:hypothetical protein